MDEVLKGLQGKQLTKKKLFDFLANINIESLNNKKNTVVEEKKVSAPVAVVPEVVSVAVVPEVVSVAVVPIAAVPEVVPVTVTITPDIQYFIDAITPEEIKCKACMKTFTAKSSLKRHHERSPVCLNWIEQPEKTDTVSLAKGLHLIIDELLDKAISGEDLECKFCKTTFTNKGNHHKHFNYSTVCNRLAYQEFKKLFLSL
jgi:hypothetical protein